MVEIEVPDDIAGEMADKLGIYGEERLTFITDLVGRIREAVRNEDVIKRHKIG